MHFVQFFICLLHTKCIKSKARGCPLWTCHRWDEKI